MKIGLYVCDAYVYMRLVATGSHILANFVVKQAAILSA